MLTAIRTYIPCSRCRGEGSVEREFDSGRIIRCTCPGCDGSGEVEARPCRALCGNYVPIYDPEDDSPRVVKWTGPCPGEGCGAEEA